MTLLDAALRILSEQKTKQTAAQLAQLAVAAKLVAKVNPAHVKQLAGKLSQLAAKSQGPVAEVDGAFVAREAGRTARVAAKKPAKKVATAKSKPAAIKAKPAASRARSARTTVAVPMTEFTDAGQAGVQVELPMEDRTAEVYLDKPSLEETAAEPALEIAIEPPVELTPEEQSLAAMYEQEMQKPAAAHAEYQDQKTADEDRQLMPEINARDERHRRWEERRDARRRDRDFRRDQRGGGGGARTQDGGGDRGGDRDRQRSPMDNGQRLAPPVTVAVAVAPGEVQLAPIPGIHRVGNAMGDAASMVFAQLRNSQPLPVRQLAGMMRKRGLLEQDAEQAWPNVKAALLCDERSYRALGLRPRIVYRGRDLFAPGPVVFSATAAAEAGLAASLSALSSATHRILLERLVRAAAGGFERVIHAYLVASGYRELEWVKRVDGISYAVALPPTGNRRIMISARSGAQAVDRRGIGELRVGVDAKQLLMGMLFAPTELSEEAQRELERPGRSISVVCADDLAATLIASGVGVVSSATRVHYVDDALLDDLLAGA
jgi:hypothetical protein